jgi:hypothetical protein
MKVWPIEKPLKNEHIVGVQPSLAPDVDAGWNRRLNLFTGRALSDTALKAEQAGRAGRMAARGQMVSPGVVTGLQLAVERGAGDALFGQLSAGLGIAVSGEDVVVPTDIRFDLRQVRVYAPGGLLAAAIPPEERANSGLSAYGWDTGPRLGAFMQPANLLPRVGIMVLQPIVADLVGELDPAEQCEIDPTNDPYEDWQLADGCRVLYYAWPDLLPQQPPPATPDAARRWRNQVAYAIFTAEAGRGPAEPLPWELAGVPVGLVGFDAAWQFQFVDRNAVVRAGGRPRRRSRLVNGWQPEDERYFSGALPQVHNPYLWQARLQQFAEQVADAYLDGTPIQEIAAQFTHLPPAGLLPADAVNFILGEAAVADRADLQHFFPATYVVDAVPAPLEQLDLALENSASLAPFNVAAPDQVRLLVPVPQAFYEPGLLKVEQVDPEFQQTLDEFITRRGRWLNRRRELRDKHAALAKALNGQAPVYPLVDPLAVDDSEAEYPQIDEDDPQLSASELAYGTELRDRQWISTALEALRQKLLGTSPLRRGSAVALPDLRDEIVVKLRQVDPRIAYNREQKQLTLQGPLSLDARDALKKVVSEMDGPVQALDALDALQTASLRDEVGQLDALGLTRFIAYLEAKVHQADDKIDFGFLRIQTDIYRVRQLMLGSTSGTRLAVSPTLATIAQGTSAASSRANLRTFYDQLKSQPATDDTAPRALEPTSSAAGAAASVLPLSAAIGERAIGNISNVAFTPTIIGSKLPSESLIAMSGTQLGATLIQKQPTSEAFIGALRTGATGVLQPPPAEAAAPIEVIGQSAIVGAIDLRTTTIAERLEPAKAPESKDFSVASKHEVVSSLADLAKSADGINLDDLVVPGVPQRAADGTILFGDPAKNEFDWLPKRETRLLKDVVLDRDIFQEPSPRRGDEAAYFVSSVELLDHTIAALRGAEGRTQAYRLAIAACQTTQTELKTQLSQAGSRLQAVDTELAEARHDVSLARALLADETARVSDINRRRDQVIREHVAFLAYQRPRTVELRRDTVSRPLIPAELADAPKACLALSVDPPAELRSLVDLFRDAPVKWFTHVPALLDQIDVLPSLQATLIGAKTRAFAQSGVLSEILASTLSAAPAQVASLQQAAMTTYSSPKADMLSSAITRVFAGQQTAVKQTRGVLAQMDLSAVATQNWRRVRDQAADVVSLGDLITGEHGRSSVAQAAARELDDIGHVAACLYQAFDEVLPVIRLEWGEILSQYDAPPDLRELTILPRWGELEYLARRQMQSLTDWLFGRVDTAQAGALALVNDLVRICILVASHAPVNQIIAGHLPRQTTVTPGIRLDLAAVNLAQINVGMHVLLFDQQKVVARAVVEDLGAGQVSAKVTTVEALDERGQVAKSVTLPPGARVQYTRQRL